MLEPGDKILVGLSGGKDSVALLHFLAYHKAELKIEVSAFHLNHMIRGAEAERDADFAENFCKKLKVEFIKEQIDVPLFAQNNKMGLEEAARECRYKALFDTAKKLLCNKIATAHTASDNCETVLYNLIRGCGRVSGIPAVRENIIRPLIYATTDEVVEYCKEKALDYVYDSTNSDTDYSRNFIRGNIVPLMRSLNPSLERTLLTPAEVSACDNEYFSSLAQAFIKENVLSDGSVKLDSLQSIAAEEKYSSLFYSVISALCGYSLSSIHLNMIKKTVLSGKHGKTVELPGMLDMTVCYDRVIFKKRNTAQKSSFCIKLKEGEIKIPLSPFGILMSKDKNCTHRAPEDIIYKNINKKAKNIFLDWNKIKGDLYIRSRKEGDRLVADKITRSVKKHLIDSKIPAHLRESFPIVCDEEGIVWVPGLPVCDRVKGGSEKKVYLSLLIY